MKRERAEGKAFSVRKMIDLSQELLASWLLRSLVFGAVAGFVYDCFYLIKKLFGVIDREVLNGGAGHKIFDYIITFICDLLFWSSMGFISVLMIYKAYDGVFRGILYIGLALGFLIYSITLRKLIRVLFGFLAGFVKKFVLKALVIILFPIKKIFYAAIYIYHLTIGKIIDKIIYKMKRLRERKPKEEEKMSESQETDGKEEFVYVDGKVGYRKNGRINFCSKNGQWRGL